MYGTIVETAAFNGHMALEHQKQRYLLEEAAVRHMLVAAWRNDAPSRRRAPGLATWRALVARFRHA
jgi:hypothetical protein